ncbi:kinase-like protein [Cucurbitaria berberidis CBS 394.84]|uniref:Kinase-like protein n=1 Tax=Cucurbitaria berberidis CBS 394.84 TaxID=1168544 RepID=A0A9P4GB87_9PLEO|nr:kinase-like protein [Cucurbitaria berberidis CBS 394.84]KAF1842628.1 kinase-like protein [Cucurbitaria berberidis CBS 394.84]
MTPRGTEDSQTGLPPPPPSSSSQRIVFQMPVFQNVEDVYMYGPGGYHPVDLGDVVGHSFKIIHKLGNGGFALVWLARDLNQDRYVALKILRSDASDNEVKILEHLKMAAGKTRITNLQETFTIHGPNGFHQCLVLDLGGPSLRRVTLYCKHPPLPFLKVAAMKIAEGVAALHEAGVCHGDLTDSNVLFEITGLQDWTEDEVHRYLGPPKTAPLLFLDGKPAPVFAPTHVVDALDYSHLNTEHLSSNILITDFGEAFFKDNVPKGLGTPASFSAPELLFGYQPSCAVDLWALGCLVFQIHTFQVLIPTIFSSDQEALAMAIETVGALPEAWQESFFSSLHLHILKVSKRRMHLNVFQGSKGEDSREDIITGAEQPRYLSIRSSHRPAKILTCLFNYPTHDSAII